MDNPPKGKSVKIRISDFWYFKVSLLSENWVSTSNLNMMRKIGVDPLAQTKRNEEEVTIWKI
jgi:hypothetical protein